MGTCDPNDRLRATEGCFLMTDMADVESIAEPTNNGKVLDNLKLRANSIHNYKYQDAN